MENTKTISYLNSKAWFRALKVIYIIFAIIFCIYSLGGGGTLLILFIFGGEEFSLGLRIIYRFLLSILGIPALLAWTWLMLQLPKWIFYYIYTGKRIPER